MKITPLPAAGFTRIPWKNGGGVSTTIAEELRGEGGGWDDVIWRLGFTDIVTPGPFSDLAGFDRLQAVLKGSGLMLDTPDGEVNLRVPATVACYRGEAPISSRLENGPVEVINLIGARGRVRLDLRQLAAGQAVCLNAGTHVLWARDGAARLEIGGQVVGMAAGDALRVGSQRAANLLALSGATWVASLAAPST